MKKRGFTLIELLAVIVILAIIALIATPIVMNVIENSKKGAAERSIENLEKAAELYYYENKLEGGFPDITFTCKNGSCSSNDKVLKINGKVPEAGSVKIDKDGTISLNSIVISGYNCYKKNDSYKCDNATKETAETKEGYLTLDSEATKLSNYRIYGNSVDDDVFVHNLPEEYQQVEYIESTGTQYIDTGIIPNQDTGFDIEFLTKNIITGNTVGGTEGYGSIMGARESSTNKELQLTTYNANDSTNYQGILRYGTGGAYNAGIRSNSKMRIVLKNRQYTNNNDVEHTLTQTFQSPVSLTLFALNQKGTISQYGLVQIYSLKIYNGDELIRNFVPCYRKSDNKIGLYDLANGDFYVNLGTGEFLKGKVIYKYNQKSVGDYNSNREEYEIPIRIIGKNLFNITKSRGFESIYGGLNNIIENNKIILNCTASARSGHLELGNFPKGTYTLSMKYPHYIRITTGDSIKSLTVLKEFSAPNKITFTLSQTQKIWIMDSSFTNTYSPFTLEDIQLELNTTNTEYEPYREEKYIIYLQEPLRCVDDVCDYIDFNIDKVIRTVGVESDGTLVKLDESISQDIELPNIKLGKGVNNIFIETNIAPSKVEIEYYK